MKDSDIYGATDVSLSISAPEWARAGAFAVREFEQLLDPHSGTIDRAAANTIDSKWSPRSSLLFVIAASTVLWTVIVFAAELLF